MNRPTFIIKHSVCHVFLLLFIYGCLKGQPCDFNPHGFWTNNCLEAEVHCDLSALNFSTCTAPVSAHDDANCNPEPACGGNTSFDNTSWFAFYTDGTSAVSISLSVNSCSIGNGIHAGIYDECPCLGGVCVDFSDGGSTVINLQIANPLPGKIYYLYVDGVAGAQCFYDLSITNSGYNFSCNPEFVISSSCQFDLPNLPDNTFCLIDGSTIVEAALMPYGSNVEIDYNFSITSQNGSPVPYGGSLTTSDPIINMNFTAADVYTLCFESASNECDDTSDCGFPFCIDINVLDNPIYEYAGEVCYADLIVEGYSHSEVVNGVDYQGPIIYLEDLDDNDCYTHTISNACGCSYTQVLCLEILGEQDAISYDVYVCEGEQFFNIPGQNGEINSFVVGTQDELCYCGVPGPDDCEIPVLITVNELSLDFKLEDWSADCRKQELLFEVLDFSPNYFNPDNGLEIEWLDADGNIIGTEMSQIFNADGTFALKYTLSQSNVFGEIFTCDSIYIFEVDVCDQCQETILLAEEGNSYSNINTRLEDNYQAYLPNCTTVKLSVDYNFSMPWEGENNMTACDEMACNSVNCNCDPSNPNVGGCFECWDFMQINFLADNVLLDSRLIGGAGTTNEDQTGRFEKLYCLQGASSVQININNQNWGMGKTNTFSNVSVFCWNNELKQLEDQTVCSSAIVSLNSGDIESSCLDSYEWTSNMNAEIVEPSNPQTFALNTSDGEIFTWTSIDSAGCQFSSSFVVSHTDCFGEFYCEELILDEFECDFDYGPVCGLDGQEYLNACQAELHYGVIQWVEGTCDNPGLDTIVAFNFPGSECDFILSQNEFSFEIEKVESDILVEVHLLREHQIETLIIEHSEDGENFNNLLSKVLYSNKIDFDHLHQQPKSGPNYYRIKTIDQFGNLEYSIIKVIKIDEPDFAIEVFPNPFSEEILITKSGLGEASLSIFKLDGTFIKAINISSNERTTKINLEELISDIYLIKTSMGSKTQIDKIVKY